MSKTEYVNGSDMLCKIAGKAVGHCSTHTVSIAAETKDLAVKPVTTVTTIGSGLWGGKTVSGLSVTISAEGYQHYSETEGGYADIAALMVVGQSVEVQCFERANDAKPYL